MAITVDPEPVWDQPNPVPNQWIETVDENVAKRLPEGSKIIGIFPFGHSYFTRTAKIQTVQADGTPRSLFLKVTQNEVGKAMVSGEYESMKALHSTSPDLTPEPIAWGTFAQADHVHFFLREFVDMTDNLPAIEPTMKMLAGLHAKSSSPNGRYGFHVPTLQGTFSQFTEWTDSLEVFFAKSIRLVFENEERSQGLDEEVQHLCNQILSNVVPRLLRPLETGGRHIEPRLIHGDIWDGNTLTNIKTSLPVVFDATCIYAHNECVTMSECSFTTRTSILIAAMELAPLRPVRHRMGKEYVEAYFKYFERSPPTEDQDDRNALYCLRWDMNCSALYPGNLRYRKMFVQVMEYLTRKYADGYDGWAKAHEESILPR